MKFTESQGPQVRMGAEMGENIGSSIGNQGAVWLDGVSGTWLVDK